MTKEEKLTRKREAQARYKVKHPDRVRAAFRKHKRNRYNELEIKKRLWHESPRGQIQMFMHNLRYNYKMHVWTLRYLDGVCEVWKKKVWHSAINRMIKAAG